MHKPPVSLPAIGFRLARGVLHQLRQEDPQHHERPQLNIPTQDARWFLLCNVDGVTVTTADGRGVVYRQRDRAKMFALLRTSCVSTSGWPASTTGCAVYRDALPALSSQQKREAVLNSRSGGPWLTGCRRPRPIGIRVPKRPRWSRCRPLSPPRRSSRRVRCRIFGEHALGWWC